MQTDGSADYVCFPAGDIIFEEGSSSKDVYLVKTGLVGIYKTSRIDGHRTNLAVLGPGSVFGEMAAASGRLRTASAICLSECSLIRLSGSDIQKKLNQADPIIREIVETLISHLTNANSLVVGKQTPLPPVHTPAEPPK